MIADPAEGVVAVVVATHQVPHTVIVSVAVSTPLPARLKEGFIILSSEKVRKQIGVESKKTRVQTFTEVNIINPSLTGAAAGVMSLPTMAVLQMINISHFSTPQTESVSHLDRTDKWSSSRT